MNKLIDQNWYLLQDVTEMILRDWEILTDGLRITEALPNVHIFNYCECHSEYYNLTRKKLCMYL